MLILVRSTATLKTSVRFLFDSWLFKLTDIGLAASSSCKPAHACWAITMIMPFCIQVGNAELTAEAGPDMHALL